MTKKTAGGIEFGKGNTVMLLKKKYLTFALSICMILSVFAILMSADSIRNACDNPLHGKKILFCGDSICEAHVEKIDPRYSMIAGWAGRIGSYNDMNWLNKGTSGATVSNIRGDNTVYAQLESVIQDASGYDIVILQGGGNDGWSNAPVGKMSDSFNSEEFDLSTFAGGLEYTLWLAKTKFVKAEIGYIISERMPVQGQGYGSLGDMSGYFDLAKEICDKWEIPYLDLYNDETLIDTTIPTYNDDKIHPTHEGYEILYPYIERFVKGLYDDGIPATPEPTQTSFPVTGDLTATPDLPQTPFTCNLTATPDVLQTPSQEDPTVTPSETTYGTDTGTDTFPIRTISAVIVIAFAVIIGGICIVLLIFKRKQ